MDSYDLLNMDDDRFREVVDRDLRRETPAATSDALRSPKVVDRWLAVLTSMMKNVENTLAFRTQDFEANRAQIQRQLARTDKRRRPDPNEPTAAQLKDKLLALREAHARSRAKTLRFKAGLEETLIEARYLWDRTHPDLVLVKAERDAFEQRCNVLERAVREHRRQAIADEDLYALVG